MAADYPIIHFPTQDEWLSWLDKNHEKESGVWIKIAKKSSGIPSIDHDLALEVALCYGWIDGQSKSLDEVYYLQKFTPRGKRSMWSKRNQDIVARLIKDKKMHEAGLKEIELAKKDGRWEAAYDSPKNMKMPEDFLEILSKNKKAHEFFKTLNKTNQYAIAFRLATAKKPETRERRMKVILELLENGKKFY